MTAEALGGIAGAAGVAWKLLRALALAYAVLCLFVFLLQRRLVYFPGPAPSSTPADAGLDFEDVRFGAEDGVALHGWLLRPRDGQDVRGCLLVSHGNAGSIEHRIALARDLTGMGLAVFLYDYRGYGASEGEPSEAGLYRDVQAAYEAVLARGFSPERVVLFGESLGGGPTIELARRRPVAGVIVESTFASLPSVGARFYPWLPVRLLARDRFANVDKVASIGAPLLVIHSPDDDVVPFEQARTLFEAAREPKRLLRTAGGHNDGGFRQSELWRAEVARFLDEVLG